MAIAYLVFAMRHFLKILLLSIFFNTYIFGYAFASVSYERIKRQEPSYSQIVQAFYQKEHLTNHHWKSLAKKIKTAPLLPTLYVGYDQTFREDQGMGISDNVSISSGTITLGPDERDYDYGSFLGHTVRVRAVWKLDELVFNRNYFILNKEKRDLAKVRSDMETRLFKIYEQRNLALLKYLQLSGVSRKKADIFYAKYQSMTAKLDAMTDGVFRKRWWKRVKGKGK